MNGNHPTTAPPGGEDARESRDARSWGRLPTGTALEKGVRGTTAGKIGMWAFLASDAMGFGGLLLAYAMLRVRATAWPDPAARLDRPLAAVLTFILLLSGATMTAAVNLGRVGRWRAARRLLWLTAMAGAVFVAGQVAEFQALVQTRHVGLTADHAAAIFYVITGYHGLHVLAGVVLLAIVAGRVPAGATGAPVPRMAAAIPTLEVTSLYWQFVDMVWIVIFTVLYLLPGATSGG